MEGDRVPILRVVEDMNNDCGIIRYAARDYYRTTYATPEDVIQMDKEDKRETAVAIAFMLLFVASFIYAIISSLI